MEQRSKHKLENKIILFCVMFTLVLSTCIAGVGYYTYKANILERYQVYTGTLLDIAAGYLDGEEIGDCIASQKESEQYQIFREALGSMKERSEISHIYAVYFPDAADRTRMNYVMNGTTKAELEGRVESEVVSHLGEACGPAAFDSDMMNQFWSALFEEGGPQFRYIANTTADYGYQMTGYTVIRDSGGEPVCLLSIDVPMNRISQNIRSYLLTVIAAAAGLLMVFLFLFIKVMNRNVITPVKEIAFSASDFVEQTHGMEDPSMLQYKRVEVKTQDEIGILSDSLTYMTDELKHYMANLRDVTAEKERIGAELDVATHIQASMLPCIFPAFPNRSEFDIYATMLPAKEVGGDFYDFFLIDDSHLAVVVADVSGKGVPAALFMVIAKTLIKNHAQEGEEPSEVFANVNRQLCENNEANLFVTSWMGVLDLNTRLLTYVNAGHNPPLLKRSGGEFEYLKVTPGFILAGMEGIPYQQDQLQLGVNDMLYLYTDGVTEATDICNCLYGEERLKKKLNEDRDKPLEEILHSLKADIDTFVKGAPQFDDITMVVLKFF